MMPALLIVIIVIGGFYLLRAPLRPALVGLLAVTFLVPSALRFPGSTSGYPSVHRLALAAFCANLLLKVRRGEISADVFRPTKLHAALVVYTAVSFVNGTVLGDIDVPVASSLFLWVFIVDQAVFFTFVLAAIRAIGDIRWVARAVAGIVAVFAAIAVSEHFTRKSYSAWFFHDLGEQRGSAGSFPLGTRGGDVRVHSAADFTLVYAGVASAMLPLVTAVAARARHRIALVVPALVAISIVWTYTRSSYLWLAILAVGLVVGSRLDRRIVGLVAVGAAAALFVVGSSSAFSRSFSTPEAEASSTSREERFPAVLRLTSERPYTGIGFAALSRRAGFQGTDASYLQTYTQVGLVGVLAFVSLLTMSILAVLPGLRAPPGLERTLAAAVVAGMAVGVATGASYNAAAAFRPYWLLAAIGVALAERVPRRATPTRRSRLRVLLPVAGLAAGLVLRAVAPAATSVAVEFETVNLYSNAVAGGPQGFLGTMLVNTACEIITATAAKDPRSEANCYNLRTEAGAEVGLGHLSIRAATRDHALDRARVTLRYTRRWVPGLRVHLLSIDPPARSTWARTAPLWSAAAGAWVALVVPPLRVRRRRPRPSG